MKLVTRASPGVYVLFLQITALRRAVVAGLPVLLAAIAWFLAVVPAVLAFAFAIGLAVGWCVWLQRHPDEADSSALPSVPPSETDQGAR